MQTTRLNILEFRCGTISEDGQTQIEKELSYIKISVSDNPAQVYRLDDIDSLFAQEG